MKNKSIILLTLITALLLLGNFLFLDNYVTQCYNNGSSFIDYFFPRFSVERNRLPLAFFIEKKNQVIFRSFLLISVILFVKNPPEIKVKPIQSIDLNIKAFFLTISIFTSAWILDIPDLVNMNIIYQPVKILKLFTLPQPSHIGAYLLFSLTALGAFYSVIKTNSIISVLSLLGFILVQAIFSSYQKIDHGFTSFIYLGLAFSLHLFRKKELQRSSNIAVLIISLCYCQAGLEKVFTSGLELFNTENILTHLTNHTTIVSNWLNNLPILSEGLFLLIILFQLSFPIILFQPKLKALYLIGGISFHLGVYFFLGVGWWVSPWSVALLLLIDWNPVSEKLRLANKKYNSKGA